MATRTTRRPGVGLAIAAGVIAFLDVGLYVALIVEQGEDETGAVAIVAGIIVALGALAIAAGAATSWPARTRLLALGAATGGLLATGVLGIFSIGLPLLIAGVCCLFAWGRIAGAERPVPDGAPLGSAVAGVVTGALAAALILAT